MSGGTIVKRFLAYLIDSLLITLISSLLFSTFTFINPHYKEYEKISKEVNETTEKFTQEEISREEYVKTIKELDYDLNKNGYVYIIITVTLTMLYFGVLPYFSHGQTLGKKLLNLKIVGNKEQPLKIYNYLLRSFILNGIIFNIFTLVGICFNRKVYNILNTIGSDINSVLFITIALMILFNKEGMGLHDVLARTKVISIENQKVIKPQEEK